MMTLHRSAVVRCSFLALAATGAVAVAAVDAGPPVPPSGDAIPATSPAETPGFEPAQGPLRVGDATEAVFETAHPYAAPPATTPRLVFSQEIHHPGATYVCPHFRRFELAEGDYVVVRSPDGVRTWTYDGFGTDGLGREGKDGFWGIHIHGDRAVIELYSRGGRGAYGYTIDQYAHGFDPAAPESICGSDDTQEAKCYQASQAQVYNRARAVARLLINGQFLCTGWLVGDEGHLMTNNHCISTQAQASNTNYEFMAEGANCAQDCRSSLACPGVVVATSATLVKTSSSLDYTLVRLPSNPTGTYGFLQLRQSGPSMGERIYIPQHPSGWGKRIAVWSSYPANAAGYCQIDSLAEPSCSGGPDVGYWADTRGGSSGSPVLAYSDHLVVALHHCRGSAYCTTNNPAIDDPNRGTPIQAVITNLGNDLPRNAIPVAPCPGDTNGDMVVNATDLFDVIANLGPCAGCPQDINGDNVVDVIDFILVIIFWGPCPVPIEACCYPDGTCLDTTLGYCALTGGTYRPGQTCAAGCF